VKTIRSAFGRTVNDVVLAAVASGLRELLSERGDDADRAVVPLLVSVSTRHDDGHGVLDNRVSALLYELSVHLSDPVERPEIVHDQMTKLRASHIHEMLEYRPFVPISRGQRVGTAIMSYKENLFFGVTGDYETMPDVGVLATAVPVDVEEFRHRALVRLRREHPNRARADETG
jgi:hypothetical protein